MRHLLFFFIALILSSILPDFCNANPQGTTNKQIKREILGMKLGATNTASEIEAIVQRHFGKDLHATSHWLTKGLAKKLRFRSVNNTCVSYDGRSWSIISVVLKAGLITSVVGLEQGFSSKESMNAAVTALVRSYTTKYGSPKTAIVNGRTTYVWNDTKTRLKLYSECSGSAMSGFHGKVCAQYEALVLVDNNNSKNSEPTIKKTPRGTIIEWAD